MGTPEEIIDEIIAKRWQIIEYLGGGSMSYVYRARDIETGKVIVLKLIKNLSANSLSDLESLAEQAKHFIALNHENIASYYDMCVCDKGLFLFCDYLTGESLSSLMSKAGKLPLERCIEFFNQIIAGLEYAHEQNIMHGDLRPSNIYVVNDQFNSDEPKIVDFGFIQILERMICVTTKNTSSKHPILGDAPYMSPEQRLGQNVDARCDLYSLGCLMYELACGKTPFVSKSVMETTYKQKHKAPIELAQLLPAHPLLSRYQLIVNKLLLPNARERYQSAFLVGQDLDLITTEKEQEWQRKANVLKKPRLWAIFAYKWQWALGTIALTFLILLVVPLVSIITQYCLPWTDKSFDNNKLWLAKYTEKPSAKLLEQRDFLINRLSEVAQTKGKSSQDYIRTLFLLSRFFFATGQFNEGITKLNELQKIEALGESSISQAELCANIALAQESAGDFNSARESAQKAFEMSDSNTRIEVKVAALKVLGDICNEKNDINQAEQNYLQMYNLAKMDRLKNAAEYAYSNALLADIWRKQNKLKESEKLYKEAIDWGSNYIGQRGLFLSKACYGLALLYYQEGNFRAADYELKRALPIALARLGQNNDFINAIESLSDYILFHENIFAWSKAKIENIKNHRLF